MQSGRAYHMFAIAVTFQIHPEQWDSFLPHMLRNAQTSLREEPGCRQFDVCTDPDRPHEVFLYELYDTEAAFGAHTSSAHYAAFQQAIDGMVASKDVRSFRGVAQ